MRMMTDSKLPIPERIRYVAEIAPVREIALLGTVEAEPWRERLKEEGLFPAEKEGRAPILLGGTTSRFKGIAFGEFIVAMDVRLAAKEGPPEGIFLFQAYNTNRFFAWVERTCFSTPYLHGKVEVEPTAPACLRASRGDSLLKVEMDGTPDRESTFRGEDGWMGPVFLPKSRRKPYAPGKFFLAKIHGETVKYPFLAGRDRMDLVPGDDPVLGWLADSGLSLEEWVLRPAAAHAKSKTYGRG